MKILNLVVFCMLAAASQAQAGLGRLIGELAGTVVDCAIDPQHTLCHEGGWREGNWGGGRGGIRVLSAMYGGCGRYENVAGHVQSVCGGQISCPYLVDSHVIGDPAYGCHKDFNVEYLCPDGMQRSAYAPPEASGSIVQLNCW